MLCVVDSSFSHCHQLRFEWASVECRKASKQCIGFESTSKSNCRKYNRNQSMSICLSYGFYVLPCDSRQLAFVSMIYCFTEVNRGLSHAKIAIECKLINIMMADMTMNMNRINTSKCCRIFNYSKSRPFWKTCSYEHIFIAAKTCKFEMPCITTLPANFAALSQIFHEVFSFRGVQSAQLLSHHVNDQRHSIIYEIEPVWPAFQFINLNHLTIQKLLFENQTQSYDYISIYFQLNIIKIHTFIVLCTI